MAATDPKRSFTAATVIATERRIMADRTCPFCSSSLVEAYLYLRGLSVGLHYSARPDVSLFSRSDLTQINLKDISESDPGAQAIIGALRCPSCGSISFKATS